MVKGKGKRYIVGKDGEEGEGEVMEKMVVLILEVQKIKMLLFVSVRSGNCVEGKEKEQQCQ